ncbi:MAG TPA: hypothetical protein VMF07_08355 [Solirubrobacteraceae bacterium]|nr:hypothetical protein [Solirubrobacteraceae bacterium]
MSVFESPAAPYEALEATIRRELELVVARDFDRLAAVKRERAAIVKLIAPVAPPPEARAALERCLDLQAEIAAELGRVRSAIVRDLARVRTARRAAAGYAPAHASHRRVLTSA